MSVMIQNKNFSFPFLLLTLILILAHIEDAYCQDTSFWGIDPHPDEWEDISDFNDIGNSSFGIEFLNWDTVVPSESIAEQGHLSYSWSIIDWQIQEVEAVLQSTCFL